MKFLIDENLPPALADMVRQSGFEARHANEYANTQPISDNAFRRLSLHHGWIIITRDDDFVKSYLSRKVPEKLVFVYGLSSRSDILSAFEKHWQAIVLGMAHYELIELNPSGLKYHF